LKAVSQVLDIHHARLGPVLSFVKASTRLMIVLSFAFGYDRPAFTSQ
jgi:hypothetical protein